MRTQDIMAKLQAKYPLKIVERMVEPDRIFTFRVTWVDDRGEVQTNLGYRVQFNSAIGPYKGGLRFHRAVTPSMLKFLGFEQTFKNALTTLPMGGAKGGSDFDPVGKSNDEIMRFCQAFMLELWNCIGPDQDVPAGDVGVGGREIGYMYGMYKKLARQYNTGVLTGKGGTWGGSILRPEATGFGALYFTQHLLEKAGKDIKGKTIALSGFGNVAWGAATKAKELGAKVVAISGPDGVCHIPDGITKEMIDYMLVMRASNRNMVEDMATELRGRREGTGRQRLLVLLRSLQHGLPAGRHPLFPAQRHPLRAGQGRERGRRRHLRSRNDPERGAHQLERRGSGREAPLHHEVHPRAVRRHPAGRLRRLREGREHRRFHEGGAGDARAGHDLNQSVFFLREGGLWAILFFYIRYNCYICKLF